MTPPEEPKDLGVKIGTEAQVLWEGVKKEALILIKQSKDSLVIQRALLTVAEENIEIEKKKLGIEEAKH